MSIYHGLIDVDNKTRYCFNKNDMVRDVFDYLSIHAITVDEIPELVKSSLEWDSKEDVDKYANYIQNIFKNSNKVWYLYDLEFIHTCGYKSNSGILIDIIEILGIRSEEYYSWKEIDVINELFKKENT